MQSKIVLAWAATLTLVFIGACQMTPFNQARADQVREEQSRDYSEQQNLERRIADLVAGASPISPGEVDALRNRVAELEEEIREGDETISDIKTQDSNQQGAMWGSAVAGILGLLGLGKATLGRSRGTAAVETLRVQVDRGELEVDRLANELHKKIEQGEAVINTKLSQLAGILQAFQQGMNTVPPAPLPPEPTMAGNGHTSTPSS